MFVYKIKKLDTNSDGLINKEEWPGLVFSVIDLNGESIATDKYIIAFIK